MKRHLCPDPDCTARMSVVRLTDPQVGTVRAALCLSCAEVEQTPRRRSRSAELLRRAG